MASLDSRPSKRTRTDSVDGTSAHPPSDATPTANLKRCEEFWLDDGNLVLVAKDAGAKIPTGQRASSDQETSPRATLVKRK